MDERKKALAEMLLENTVFYETGFSVDLKTDPDRWDALVSAVGVREACAFMAEALCRRYRTLYGREFLFSARCVDFELRYHLTAYLWAMGYPGYSRHITTYLFSREKLIRHCREIDISTGDISSLRQRVMFGYKKGVRPVYRSTSADPFRRRK